MVPKRKIGLEIRAGARNRPNKDALCTTQPYAFMSRIIYPTDTSNYFFPSRTHLLYYEGSPRAWPRLAREAKGK